uniref:palmitoyl-CoA hydrolase n=1 Tax=Magallana gigas TaxID=29159 RepID=K1RRS5_MAGGI
MFEKLCSLRPMWYQIGKINEQVREIMRGHPEGVHFVCYSQGGLLCRGIVSSMNHNVHNFISLSSPQAGQYGNPHHQTLYRNYSVFLSHLDGSTPSPNMSEYKRNFLKLHRLVLIGGPDDDVVTPWQSSHFSFYDENENVVEMKKQKFFQDDSFGLQTLYNKKRVHIHTFPGVVHKKWYANRTVFNSAILPYLT